MINQLLDNPAYMRLFKQATSLNGSEINKVTSDVISPIPPTLPMIIAAAKPATAPPTNLATVINPDPPKNNGFGKFILIMGVGILGCFAAYNIYKNHNKKNKSI